MSDQYPQEYLDSALAQGYRDYWDGFKKPATLLPKQERDAWQVGYDMAETENDGD